ncbi:MAG: hypothetical protein COX52_04885 [Syntrophobacterales bacterium CG23_combo_of_CG06-09_8_20_14_all_48_27]|nr:MAG: hypothetical protein COX52_04885 [Syntrophobacterales bacterium CG23_combo_of_CG06-09_8_20_14_all_48_27]
MPTVLRYGGYRFFFFSNEGNEPPHIHVETAENYAKFRLNPVALVKSTGYNAKELRELRELIEENRLLFIEKWHGYFGSQGN